MPRFVCLLSSLLLAFSFVTAALAGHQAARVASSGAEAEGKAPLVVFLGDSITAGWGLRREQAFPALVEAALRARNVRVEVVNAGRSGDTSAGGLRRLPPLLARRPALLVVELGALDGLRLVPLGTLESNLRTIVASARSAGVPVLLLGMRLPTNYGGPGYATAFAELFPSLARELSVPLVPFVLEGIAGNPELTFWDRLHPNAQGQRRIGEAVLPYVMEALRGREV
jgi:acyl-CoA thioesterase-1